MAPLLASSEAFAETDYSAFDRTIHLGMRRIEWELYRPYFNADEELAYIVLICLSVIQHAELGPDDKDGRLILESMRYSGEPGTSIGNALINLFVWWSNPERMEGFAFAEGDDGFVGSAFKYDCAAWAATFGLDLKCDWHVDWRLVKFCGRYMGTRAETVVTYCDVRRALDKFHLTMGDPEVDDTSLLRGKCLSALCMDKDTPGVGWCAYAHYLRAGDGPVAIASDDRWKRELLRDELVVGAPDVTTDDYENMRCQGLDPAALRAFDCAMMRWAVMGGEKPLIDLGPPKLKVEVYEMDGALLAR